MTFAASVHFMMITTAPPSTHNQLPSHSASLPTSKVGPRWREGPLEEEMATHSSILAGGVPRTEEPGGLWSMGSQRVGHDEHTRRSKKGLRVAVTYPWPMPDLGHNWVSRISTRVKVTPSESFPQKCEMKARKKTGVGLFCGIWICNMSA